MSDAAPTISPPAAPAANGGTLAKLNSPVFTWPAAAILAALLFGGLRYFFDALTHESTDDAFIAGHVVSIAPRVDGQVSAVHVLDNQLIRSNDLLVEIDPSDYNITVAQKQAAAASQDANFRTVVAAYELMSVKVATAKASTLKARADADAADATAKKAQSDFARAQDLLKQNTISQQEFDSRRPPTPRRRRICGPRRKTSRGKFQGGRGGASSSPPRSRPRTWRSRSSTRRRPTSRRAIEFVLHENFRTMRRSRDAQAG
jgi:hypothetical protein